MRVRLQYLLLSSLAFVAVGCSGSFAPSADSPTETPIGHMVGSVHGGQQPIYQAKVYLYAAATTSAANTSTVASTSLLKSPGYVTTDTNGGFTITGDYTCTSGTQVYLLSLGGYPTDTTAQNSAIGLMAALGTCPTTGTFSTSSFIYMNEVSTVAAAYALAGWAADSVHVSTDGSTLANTGLANAFLTAQQIANVNSGNISQTAQATTTNGYGTLDQKRINTLADAMAACINSGGSTSTACATYLKNQTIGTTTTLTATDTATATMYIARNPAYNTAALYALPTTSAPFTPKLTAAPNDFSLQISYAETAAGYVTNTQTTPHGLGVDAAGNLWHVNNTGNSVSVVSPLGVPVSGTAGFTSGGVAKPRSVAIDASGNGWLTNYSTSTLTKMTSAGTGTSYGSSTNLLNPIDAQWDYAGYLWAIDASDGYCERYTSAGVFSNYCGSGVRKYVSSPTTISAGGSNSSGYLSINTSTGSGYTVVMSETGASVATDTLVQYGLGSAISSTGNVFFAETDNYIDELTPSNGQSYFPGPSSSSAFDGLTVDSGGLIWTTDTANKTLFTFNSAGTTLSPSTGYIPSATTTPNAVVIDGSGNVWYDTLSDGTLHEVVGSAGPVVTPLSTAVYNNTIALRP